MEAIIFELLNNFWNLLTSIAIYILVGVLIAAVFKQFLPDTFIKKHLGGKNFYANIKAAVLGVPLPLCSCSVIPFVSALKKSGASKSAIQTFLIATPITGADSILATYGVLGWFFTLYRTLTSIIIALLAGMLSLIFVREENVNDTGEVTVNKVPDIKLKVISSISKPPISMQTHSMTPEKRIKENKMITKIKEIFEYAFDDIYQDIAKSLLIGIALGAIIMTFMPENLSEYLSANLLLNYFLVLLISMPLYVCATSSVPMGVALLAGGFSPGAVFIFLTAGPATNAITMSVVSQSLGKRSLVVYLFSILAGSLLFAYILDVFFTDALGSIRDMVQIHESFNLINQFAALIMLYLSLKYSVKKTQSEAKSSSCGSDSCD